MIQRWLLFSFADRRANKLLLLLLLLSSAIDKLYSPSIGRQKLN